MASPDLILVEDALRCKDKERLENTFDEITKQLFSCEFLETANILKQIGLTVFRDVDAETYIPEYATGKFTALM